MKLRVREDLRSPLGVFYRICFECAGAFKSKGIYEEASRPFRDAETQNRLLSEYWNHDAKSVKKSVVYTCVTNGYDDIAEIAVPSFVNCKWDYVCFTDNPEHIKAGRLGVWKMRPLSYTQLDDTRNNRWHKFHPDLLFPDYAESIPFLSSLLKVIEKR